VGSEMCIRDSHSTASTWVKANHNTDKKDSLFGKTPRDLDCMTSNAILRPYLNLRDISYVAYTLHYQSIPIYII
jgi:hypothetical protein